MPVFALWPCSLGARRLIGRSQDRNGLEDPEATINQVLEDGDEVKVMGYNLGCNSKKMALFIGEGCRLHLIATQHVT